MAGKRPEKKSFGRDGPPSGYPKDQAAYADPENWRYPLHTSWNAKAARRYFDEPSNRAKYSEEEQTYIDSRIDEALRRFGQESTRTSKRPVPKAPARKDIEELSLDQLLKLFLGAARLKRAREIENSLVSISEIGLKRIDAKVKDYIVQIDLKDRTILHDCEDWRNNIESKNMCKHLGKLFLSLDNQQATDVLRDVLKNKDQWKFIAPEKKTS